MPILDFGMHKGRHFDDVPLAYKMFLAGWRLDGVHAIQANPSHAGKWVQEHKPRIHDYACQYLEGRCLSCGGKIVPIGSSRRNGAGHNDWDGRHLHKRCWRQIMMDQDDY